MLRSGFIDPAAGRRAAIVIGNRRVLRSQGWASLAGGLYSAGVGSVRSASRR